MKLTLSIIKPDAVKRNLIGKINTMIEDNYQDCWSENDQIIIRGRTNVLFSS